jgi:death-on-curing protein
MMEPLFLTVEEVILLNQSQIEAHGGIHGIRDRGSLESALGAPQNHFAYVGGDLFDLAGALMAALTRNHPFLDGNKRTGLLAASVFLELNGVDLPDSDDWLKQVEDMALGIACGTQDKEEAAELFRHRCGA